MGISSNCLLNFTMMMSNRNLEQLEDQELTCLFQRGSPSVSLFVIYGLAVPTLATFGLCTNFINAIVFMRPKMTPSAFTYLAALSCLDCVSCILITLTAVSRSYFYKSGAWIAYDFQWQTPLFGISTGAANLILACVSCDRFIYLTRFRVANGTPRFCRRKVARIMIVLVIVLSIIVNIPYFFVFVVDRTDGTWRATDFYYSDYYRIHNWFSFTLLAVLPAIFLMIGNAMIIVAFRRWTKQSKVVCDNRSTQKRYHHQMKLTISIVIVITLYMLGELPAHMTSRKSALNLLFGGDLQKVNLQLLEHLEVICITLNALQLSLNIVVYAVINPSFMPEFFLCLRGISDACFRVCCLTAIARCWRKHFKSRSNCNTNCNSNCAARNANEQQMDEIDPTNDVSWSSDRSCENTNAKTTEDTNDTPDNEKQPDIFVTKASGCSQQDEHSRENDDNSRFSSTIFIVS